MAGLVVALYLIRLLASRKSEGENWSWKRFAILGVLPIFTLIAAHQSWGALVRAKVDNAPFSTPIDLEMLVGANENSAPAHWQEVQENFVFALTNFPINFGGTILIPQVQLIALFLLLIGVLEYLVSRRSGQKFNFGLIVITALGAVAYTGGLLVLYLFRFGDFEAVRLASYERYLATYWAGIILLIVLVALWLLSVSPRESNGEDSSKARVGAAKPVFALFLFVTISALMPIQQISEFFQNPSARGTEVRSSLEPALEQLSRVQIKPTDKVWIIAQHTAGREYLMLRYEPLENSVNPGG